MGRNQRRARAVLAALRRCGYRAKHRYIVFKVLPRTLGDRLAASVQSPAKWHRDEASLRDRPVACEVL